LRPLLALGAGYGAPGPGWAIGEPTLPSRGLRRPGLKAAAGCNQGLRPAVVSRLGGRPSAPPGCNSPFHAERPTRTSPALGQRHATCGGCESRGLADTGYGGVTANPSRHSKSSAARDAGEYVVRVFLRRSYGAGRRGAAKLRHARRAQANRSRVARCCATPLVWVERSRSAACRPAERVPGERARLVDVRADVRAPKEYPHRFRASRRCDESGVVVCATISSGLAMDSGSSGQSSLDGRRWRAAFTSDRSRFSPRRCSR
jgi:hypothetical protein